MKVLITGSGGLVGSTCARMHCDHGDSVIGVDNDMRGHFFGEQGSTKPLIKELCRTYPNYHHHILDIRDREDVRDLIAHERPKLIIHAAAQPSHDKAASIPYDDFDVNAGGTMNLLVAARDYCGNAPFIFVSTNKVYGDAPNRLPLHETLTRFECDGLPDGINESMPIDASLHSLFGASKLAADVMCQEFGRYFDMPVGIFRCGCITGPAHAAVEQHGFLAYLVACAVEGREYTIHGYGGKQVRDQIHAEDLARLFRNFAADPNCGEVYNVGGGTDCNVSVIEAIGMLAEAGFPMSYTYDPKPRKGDHIWYVSDLRKVRDHFPNWQAEHGLASMIGEIIEARAKVTA